MNDQEVLEMVFKNLEEKDIEKEKVLVVLRYGKRGGNDIDIFTLINMGFDYYRYLSGKIEITTMGAPNSIPLLNGFDPIITEPVLTGEILHENILRVSELEKYLRKTRADQSTTMHLKKMARQTLQWARTFYEQQEPENALINLVFHFSYLNFAHYYEKHPKVITFEKLIKEHADRPLKKSYARLKSPDPITLEEVKTFLS